MFKQIIRNEHRESFAAGKLEEIPAEALKLLQEQAAATQKEPKKTKAKDQEHQ